MSRLRRARSGENAVEGAARTFLFQASTGTATATSGGAEIASAPISGRVASSISGRAPPLRSGGARRRWYSSASISMRTLAWTAANPTRACSSSTIWGQSGETSASLPGNGLSVTALRKEISTCEVVCANCHRKRTASRNGSWRGRPETIERKGSTLQGRTKARAYVRDVLLDSACADCGISDLVVLEFDHIGPKRANVSDLVREGYGTARIQAEIDRCEVRCANCHRRRTRAIGTRKAR